MTYDLLMAAHDTGGGRILAALLQPCRDAGYSVDICSSGPACRVLPTSACVSETHDWRRELEEAGPAIVLTGTSGTSSFESTLWEAAREKGVASIALLDASINLSCRFALYQPTIVCAPDAETANELEKAEWCKARAELVGQPHLECIPSIANHVGNARETHRRIVFFSEPIAQKPGEAKRIGFDQYEVAEQLVAALHDFWPLSLVVKPHPNEDAESWQVWLKCLGTVPGIEVTISQSDALELMEDATCVAGVASMALIEASLAGVPVLALQPGRRYCPNPNIDENTSIQLLTDKAGFQNAVQEFVRRICNPMPKTGPGDNPYSGSIRRVLNVIAETIENTSLRHDLQVRR